MLYATIVNVIYSEDTDLKIPINLILFITSTSTSIFFGFHHLKVT